MIKRILITLLVFHLLAIFQGCCPEMEREFRWFDFEIQILDNSGEIPIITEETNLNKNALGMRILLEPLMGYNVNTVSSRKFKIISECYAISCENYKFIKLHKLIAIQVITVNDYSENYPANSDITELFKAREINKTKSDYTSIDNIISIINNKNDATGSFDLFLIDKNANSGEHIFEIRLKFSDDIEMVKQTATLNLY